jgi:hypothetical protein
MRLVLISLQSLCSMFKMRFPIGLSVILSGFGKSFSTWLAMHASLPRADTCCFMLQSRQRRRQTVLSCMLESKTRAVVSRRMCSDDCFNPSRRCNLLEGFLC